MTTGRINQVTTIYFLSLLPIAWLQKSREKSNRQTQRFVMSLGYCYDLVSIHSMIMQILNNKIHFIRMHPFRSVNMFFSQFMQTQSRALVSRTVNGCY
jgi:hypothetical protein